MVEITAHEVYKSYIVNGSQTAVINNFSYEFTDGNMYCVWGASGSGKSTLLKILGLLTEPTSGVVAYDSKIFTSVHDRSRFLKNKVGWVLQNENLINNLSLIDNLKIGSPNSHSQQEIEQVLDDVGLIKSIGKKGKHLSGGEAQRLAFARAILKKPQVLIIDEFTSGLDAGSEDRLIGLARKYTESGVTTLIASHSPKVRAVADHVLEVDSNA